MKRRDFLKSVSGLAAGAMVPAPAIFSPVRADARSETLLIVSEGKVGGLVFVGVCAAMGAGICWIGRRSGVMLLIGLLLIALAVFCGVLWFDAAL